LKEKKVLNVSINGIGRPNPEITRVKRERYLVWLADDPKTRQPRTKKGIMREIGIRSNQTLYNWEKKIIPVEHNTDTFLANQAAKVDKALIAACEAKSPQALQTYYKVTKKYVDKSEVDIKAVILNGDDYARILNAAAELVRKERERVAGLPE